MISFIRVCFYVNAAFFALSYNVYVNAMAVFVAIFVAYIASTGSTNSAMEDVKEEDYKAKKWNSIWIDTFMVCFASFLIVAFDLWVMVKRYPLQYMNGDFFYRNEAHIAHTDSVAFFFVLYGIGALLVVCSFITAIRPHYVFGDKIFD